MKGPERQSNRSLTVLSQDRLKEVLFYDNEDGDFYWRINRPKTPAGSTAGYTDPLGYIIISIDGNKYQAHQLVWLWFYNKVVMIDHKDNNPSNNRINNLREATYSQNNHRRNLYNPLGYTGVRYRSGHFEAHIRINGIITRLGKFNTAEEAAEAYRNAARQYFGEFAKT